VGLEVLFESRVEQLDFERSAIGEPIAEEQFAAVHSVIIGVFQIEDAHPRFFGGE
jgi:hypothetical protein